jgi:hypothetical protein
MGMSLLAKLRSAGAFKGLNLALLCVWLAVAAIELCHVFADLAIRLLIAAY